MVASAGRWSNILREVGSGFGTRVIGRAHYSRLFYKRCAQIGNKRRGALAVYHLKASFGSRAGGQLARAKSDYIEREGRYEKDSEELEYKEHGNMPEWAEDDPGSYWAAADQHERSNGRLYSEVQFALPKELNEAGRRAAASDFAAQLTGPERLPYTMAIHRGGADGENPHAHLMYSERGNDGIERRAEQWFRRYNGKAPETGGARKSRGGQGRGLAGQDPQGVGADGEPGAGAGWPGGTDRRAQPGRAAGRGVPDRRPSAGGRVEPGAQCPPRPVPAPGGQRRGGAGKATEGRARGTGEPCGRR